MDTKKAYYQKNKETFIQKAKSWAIKNPVKVSTAKEKYRQNNREKIRASSTVYSRKNRNTVNGKYSQYKSGAKKRGLIFDISIQEFTVLITSLCYYCGCNGGGIDRVDNSMGYIKDNSVPCCYVCNRMKFNYTIEEFINNCKNVAKNYE